MSRIGKKPVPIPSGVKAEVAGTTLRVRGPKGELAQVFDPRIDVGIGQDPDRIVVQRKEDTRVTRALHGLYRALAANMVVGVTRGYDRILDIVGTGYQARVEGNELVLVVGFSQPVRRAIPEGLKVVCTSPTQIQVSGIDKQKVGAFASEVRKVRPPEPYQGKGIRYQNEQVRRKAGKTLAVGK